MVQVQPPQQIKFNPMFDLHIHISDKKSLKEISEKLDRVITLLEEDGEIEGLDKIVEDLDTIKKDVETTV